MPVSCSPLWRSFIHLPIHPTSVKPNLGQDLTISLRNSSCRSRQSCTSIAINKKHEPIAQTSQFQGLYLQTRPYQSCAILKARAEQNPRLRPAVSSHEGGVILSKHRSPLSRSDLSRIFPASSIDGRQALRLLQVLQGRRQKGTLDLPLPLDLARLAVRDSRLISDGLKFLRQTYPLDEDAAIVQRIRAEEKAHAQENGRVQPQSGQFGERRGENDSVFGLSVLEQWRKLNQEKAKLEEERNLRMIDDQLPKIEGHKPGGLVPMEKQDLAVGKPLTIEDIKQNSYLKWKLSHQVNSMSHVTAEQIAGMSWAQRLLPSAIFTVLFSLGVYWFSETWYEPNRLDRMWPNMPIAAATVLGLISANAFIFLLWRMWPPAWKYLNRYFVTTPGYPYALSLLGNTFSHYRLWHLSVNMIVLWVIGVRFHEDVGRGTFLAIYLSSGVIGSFVGMSAFAIGRILNSSSQGASSSLCGILGAFCTIHSNDTLTVWFLPDEWREKVQISGRTFLIILMALDVLGLRYFGQQGHVADNVAHLAGYVVGIISSWWWSRSHTDPDHVRKKGDVT